MSGRQSRASTSPPLGSSGPPLEAELTAIRQTGGAGGIVSIQRDRSAGAKESSGKGYFLDQKQKMWKLGSGTVGQLGFHTGEQSVGRRVLGLGEAGDGPG